MSICGRRQYVACLGEIDNAHRIEGAPAIKCGQIFAALDMESNHVEVPCKNEAVYVLDVDQHVCASCKLDLDRGGGLGDLYRKIRRLDGRAPELARFKHFGKPNDTYLFVGEGRRESNLVRDVVYRNAETGELWERQAENFYAVVTWPDGVKRQRFMLEADVKPEWYMGTAL